MLKIWVIVVSSVALKIKALRHIEKIIGKRNKGNKIYSRLVMKYKLIAFSRVQGGLVHKGKLLHFPNYLLGVLFIYFQSGHYGFDGKISVPFSSR